MFLVPVVVVVAAHAFPDPRAEVRGAAGGRPFAGALQVLRHELTQRRSMSPHRQHTPCHTMKKCYYNNTLQKVIDSLWSIERQRINHVLHCLLAINQL